MPRHSVLNSLRLMLVSLVASLAPTDSAMSVEIDVSFDRSVHSEPFTGRVYIMFSRQSSRPASGPNWFGAEPFVSRDVKNLAPGESIRFDSNAPAGWLTFPREWKPDLVRGLRSQAVARFNPWEREVGRAEGNGTSRVSAPIDPDSPRFELVVNELNAAQPIQVTKWSKLLEVRSARLSEFYDRPVAVQAAVNLPASYYDQPERHYPVIYTIPGFGGTHRQGFRNRPVEEQNREGVEFIRVLLDPSCPRGHHVFADSANNGPWGTALVEDFIPALESQYRAVPKPTARFLTGHSSGGWSSLWVQVTHPDFFGGTWSTAPDPVDFHDFQRIDVYRHDENMYTTPSGERRPLARQGNTPVLWYDDFAWMEWVLGPGGQLHSFEAVFSPRGQDGTPKLLWNRETGEIDRAVGLTWKKYDIRSILERDWKDLEPRLRGKLHVHMGDLDTFYLEGATIRLKETMTALTSEAVIEIHSGKDHSSVMTAELRARIRQEMVDQYLMHHNPDGSPH